jgi:RNA polymerase sigma-32 factor
MEGFLWHPSAFPWPPKATSPAICRTSASSRCSRRGGVELAKRWRDAGDEGAAHKLVTSHLRLVAKIAMGYRGYGLPVGELISEGNVGMMQAVKRFDPERGFRLATYAMWWIRAAIQEYILHSWSLVKMGTTAAQKKLFFNLRRLKGQIGALEDGDLQPEQVSPRSRRRWPCPSRTWSA